MGGTRTHNPTDESAGATQLTYHHKNEVGFCILRILDIVSACEVWFKFIYRKQEHLAVGSSGQGLTRSHGHRTFRGCLALPFCAFIITQLRWFVKTLFEFFKKIFSTFNAP